MNAMQKELGIDVLTEKVDRLTELVAKLTLGPMPEYLTIDQVAQLEKCSTRTISRQINRGERPVTRRGKKPLIHRDDVNPAV